MLSGIQKQTVLGRLCLVFLVFSVYSLIAKLSISSLIYFWNNDLKLGTASIRSVLHIYGEGETLNTMTRALSWCGASMHH